MSDVVLVIIAPSHLAGAAVVHAWPPDDLDEAGSYNLDRPHPTEPGMIGVAVEDVRTIEIPRDLVDRFRRELGPCPETVDVDYALAVMDLS